MAPVWAARVSGLVASRSISGHDLPQAPGGLLHLLAPLVGQRAQPVVLAGAGEVLALFGDGMSDEEKLHEHPLPRRKYRKAFGDCKGSV